MPGRKHFLNDHFWQTNQSFPFCFTFMSFIHFLPKNSVSKNFSEILENELTSLEMKTVNCPFILFTITNPQRWNQATVGWVFFSISDGVVSQYYTTPELAIFPAVWSGRNTLGFHSRQVCLHPASHRTGLTDECRRNPGGSLSRKQSISE